MASDVEQWASAFKAADWIIPPYLSRGGLARLSSVMELATPADKRQILETVLMKTYDEEYLSCHLLHLYSKTRFVDEFKFQLSECIEVFFSEMYYAAVVAIIPLIEGIIRRMAEGRGNAIGQWNIKNKIISETNHLILKEKQAQTPADERILALEAFRDYLNDKWLASTDAFSGLDEFNRHGILHGVFTLHGTRLNFYRSVTMLEMLCCVINLGHNGPLFPPASSPESIRLAGYYRGLKLRSSKAAHLRAAQLFLSNNEP